MVFSDADARRFAHVVTAIETAGGEIRRAELGEQEAGGVLGNMMNALVDSSATTTTFAFVVADAGINADATSAEKIENVANRWEVVEL